MRILAFEFSTRQRSVAVLDAMRAGTPDRERAGASHEITGRELVTAEAVETAGRDMDPLGMIDDALREAALEREQIECVAVGLGPGSYSGVRAALALAQGWQLARNIPLIGISSADAIAARARAEGMPGPVTVVIDAQRDEFYVAVYELRDDSLRELEALRIESLEQVRDREQAGEVLTGPGLSHWFPRARILVPGAGAVARLALDQPAPAAGAPIEPIYLRQTTFVKAPPLRPMPE